MQIVRQHIAPSGTKTLLDQPQGRPTEQVTMKFGSLPLLHTFRSGDEIFLKASGDSATRIHPPQTLKNASSLEWKSFPRDTEIVAAPSMLEVDVH